MEKSSAQAVSRIIRLMNEAEVPANSEISVPPYNEVDGYRFANIFVRYGRDDSSQFPIDLGVAFAYDEKGLMSTRHVALLDGKLPLSGTPAAMSISGEFASSGAGEGDRASITYIVRVPVMGPFMEVFTANRAPVSRKVTVWAYMVS